MPEKEVLQPVSERIEDQALHPRSGTRGSGAAVGLAARWRGGRHLHTPTLRRSLPPVRWVGLRPLSETPASPHSPALVNLSEELGTLIPEAYAELEARHGNG